MFCRTTLVIQRLPSGSFGPARSLIEIFREDYLLNEDLTLKDYKCSIKPFFSLDLKGKVLTTSMSLSLVEKCGEKIVEWNC